MFPDLTSEEPAHDPREAGCWFKLNEHWNDFDALLRYAQEARQSAETPCTCCDGSCKVCGVDRIIARYSHRLGRG